MLNDLTMYAVLPAKDLHRARAFYEDKLGLSPSQEAPGVLIYRLGSGGVFQIYETENAGTAQNTQLGWSTDDFDTEFAHLRSAGVTFEDYDQPGLKTEDGVLADGDDKAAWFKDSEGNILCLSQMAALSA